MAWLDRTLITGPFLALVTSEAEFYKALKAMKIPKADGPDWIKTPQADATTHWMTHESGELACIVALRLREGVNGVQVAAMFAHEAVHVFQRYCEHIGEEKPSAEFQAYSIQAITQNLMTAYSQKVK